MRLKPVRKTTQCGQCNFDSVLANERQRRASLLRRLPDLPGLRSAVDAALTFKGSGLPGSLTGLAGWPP